MIQAFNPSMPSIPSTPSPANSGREAAGFSSTIGNAREQAKQQPSANTQTPATAGFAAAADDPTYAGRLRSAPSQSAPARRPAEAGTGPQPDQRRPGVHSRPAPEPVPTPKLPPTLPSSAETDLKIELEPAAPAPSRGVSAPAPDMGPGLPAPWPQPAAGDSQLRTSDGADTSATLPAPTASADAAPSAARRQSLAEAGVQFGSSGVAAGSRSQAAMQRAVDEAARGGPQTGAQTGSATGPQTGPQTGLQKGIGRNEPGPTTPGFTLPIAHDALHPAGSQSGNAGGNGSDSNQRGLNLLGSAAANAAPNLLATTAPSFAQVLASAAPAAVNPDSSLASREALIQAAPGSAEFAAQTSVQLTVFAREGVQHARLYLNPAEMGPVTVQIQLEGQAAQVHLAAENALTRQALQDALPQLASQLRESGLSLSGGGVFEQPRQDSPNNAAMQQRDGTGGAGGADGQNGRSRSNADGQADASGPDLRPANFAARRGIVDLVA